MEALQHFRDQDAEQVEVLDLMVKVLGMSHNIDTLIDGLDGYMVPPEEAERLQGLVLQMNIGTTKLCQIFHKRALFLFNFVPKHHYLFHLAQAGRHMSPKMGWCYQGEDLMNAVKVMAQGSFRGTYPRNLGNKILAKYVFALVHELSKI